MPMPESPRAWMGDSFDFSFSGVKTHVLHATQRARGDSGIGIAEIDPGYTRRLAAAFQESIVDVLATKTVAAAERFGARTILLAGGVAANRLLRETIGARSPVPVHSPPIWLCTDNAAMVGAAAFYRYEQGLQRDWLLGVKPNLRLL
jgi:N6-L-threonylcarbamoyladenine synthase